MTLVTYTICWTGSSLGSWPQFGQGRSSDLAHTGGSSGKQAGVGEVKVMELFTVVAVALWAVYAVGVVMTVVAAVLHYSMTVVSNWTGHRPQEE